jgi:hypothetical protein
MTDEELLIRANRAKEALENPLVQEALEHYEQEIVTAWKNSPLRDVEGRERLRVMLETHRAFREFLQNTMESGKLARITPPSKPDLSQFGRN